MLVWQKGMALAKLVYLLTNSFPVDERFGMVAQMRRTEVSVPSNIAEGQSRHERKEFVQFLSHAQGSLAELDIQIELAVEVGVLKDSSAEASISLVGELQRMNSSLSRKIDLRLAANH